MLECGLVSVSERRPALFKALTWHESSVGKFECMRLQNGEYNSINGDKQSLEYH